MDLDISNLAEFLEFQAQIATLAGLNLYLLYELDFALIANSFQKKLSNSSIPTARFSVQATK